MKEDFRNKYIGTALIETACKKLKNLGHSRVYIDTTAAADLFKKLGWKFVEDVKWKNETTSIFTNSL